MTHTKQHIKKVKRKYDQRKGKVNEQVKCHNPLFRLLVNRSNKFMVAQIIDQSWKTIVMLSDRWLSGETKTQRAYTLGEAIAKLAKDKWVKEQIAFDRNGYLYHGRVKNVCEWARAWWLQV